jgi:hypothetical protein
LSKALTGVKAASDAAKEVTCERDQVGCMVEAADKGVELIQGGLLGFEELLEVGDPGNELVRGEADQEESCIQEPAEYYLYLGRCPFGEVLVM